MLFTSLKNGITIEILFIQIPIVLFVVCFAALLILTALYWLKKSMTDPLVLKSPSNQSNILDISILFVMVFSFYR
jgi:hypothetical protein